jgi:hypothetical protein
MAGGRPALRFALAPTLALVLVIAGAGPAGGAAPTESACRIEGDALTAADERLARSACEAARRRFVELVGAAPAALIFVEERDGYRIGILDGQAVVLWPSSRIMRARVGAGAGTGAGADAYVASQWSDVLRHEVAHALTAAHFFPDGEFESTGYGTPLPDWFEEGLAIWAEPAPSRETRLAAARALPAERLDLEAILTMRHPAAANPAALAVRDGAAAPRDQALWDFYQQSIAVLSFVHDEGGPEAVRELATRLRSDPADDRAIVGLPGLPDSFAEVRAAWRDWIAGS